MAATTMIVVDAAAATALYPGLYPTLDNPSAHFLPIRPQEEAEMAEEKKEELQAKEEEQEEKKEEEEQEDGVMPMVNGEGREEDKEEASDRQVDQACPSPSTEVPGSPCQGSAESREATADAANGQQTTNENVSMNEDTDGQETQTTNIQLLTGEAAVNEGQLTQREEYVDRVWEEFVTHFLLGSRNIQKAAIFDLASRRPLAMNGKLRISDEELEQLVLSLHHHQLAYRNGVTIEGRTYKVRLADGRNGIWARTGLEGCTVCKTHTLVIVGVHDDSGNSRKCNEDVMRLGDFFRKKGL